MFPHLGWVSSIVTSDLRKCCSKVSKRLGSKCVSSNWPASRGHIHNPLNRYTAGKILATTLHKLELLKRTNSRTCHHNEIGKGCTTVTKCGSRSNTLKQQRQGTLRWSQLSNAIFGLHVVAGSCKASLLSCCWHTNRLMLLALYFFHMYGSIVAHATTAWQKEGPGSSDNVKLWSSVLL